MDINKHNYLKSIDMEYRTLDRQISEMEKKELDEHQKVLLENLRTIRQETLDSIDIRKP